VAPLPLVVREDGVPECANLCRSHGPILAKVNAPPEFPTGNPRGALDKPDMAVCFPPYTVLALAGGSNGKPLPLVTVGRLRLAKASVLFTSPSETPAFFFSAGEYASGSVHYGTPRLC